MIRLECFRGALSLEFSLRPEFWGLILGLLMFLSIKEILLLFIFIDYFFSNEIMRLI